MVQIKEPQPHIQLTDAVDTDCAVIVGDPARVDVVAKFLDEPEKIMENREYRTVTGTYKGRKILVMSTGIGAPSAAIGIEELHNIGVKTVIRVGSCGALQPEIGLGDLIVGEGIVRDDGLTKKYAPEIYPAVPSFKLLAWLKNMHRRLISESFALMTVFIWMTMKKWKLFGQKKASWVVIWNRELWLLSDDCEAWKPCRF